MTSPSDVERVRDAIRFAEEYGFRGWLQAQDELNAILKQIQTLTEAVDLWAQRGDAYKAEVQTLTEERDEARRSGDNLAKLCRKLEDEAERVAANEAAQIAKGLQLAAQLDEARAASTKNAITAGDALIQLDQARALLQAARDWLGCIQHFPEGCPDDCAEFQVIQRVDAFLQPSNEEG